MGRPPQLPSRGATLCNLTLCWLYNVTSSAFTGCSSHSGNLPKGICWGIKQQGQNQIHIDLGPHIPCVTPARVNVTYTHPLLVCLGLEPHLYTYMVAAGFACRYRSLPKALHMLSRLHCFLLHDIGRCCTLVPSKVSIEHTTGVLHRSPSACVANYHWLAPCERMWHAACFAQHVGGALPRNSGAEPLPYPASNSSRLWCTALSWTGLNCHQILVDHRTRRAVVGADSGRAAAAAAPALS